MRTPMNSICCAGWCWRRVNNCRKVQIADEQIEQLLAMATLCGVEGHRADTFAVYAACAAAALGLRDRVEQEDLELAVRLVILPRATRLPPPPDQPPDQAPPPPPPDAEERHVRRAA
jgi:magnesium chelatase subunit D